MGHVQFQIDQIKSMRLWITIILLIFGIPSLFRDDLKVLGIALVVAAIGFFVFCTLAVRGGNKALKHLEKHPEDAAAYDDNPLS